MKKIITKSGLVLIILVYLGSQATAISDKELDKLIGRPGGRGENAADTVGKYAETGYVANLPEIGVESLVTTTVKTILGWAMLITLVAIVVSAIYYIMSRGNEEGINKAKDILFYLIIGMAIMAAAYAIVSGISQFNFFQ